MKLTTIFRHYFKFQSQWKVNYFEQRCDWEQLPNWKQSSDFKAAKQQQGKKPKQLETPSGCCSCQVLQQMWSNSQQVDGHPEPAAQPKSTALLQELLQLWGMLLPMTGAECAKGELEPTVHGKRQDSCSHSLWECWCCTEGAQAENTGNQAHRCILQGMLLPEAQITKAVLEEQVTFMFSSLSHRSNQSSWKPSGEWLAVHSSSSAQSPMEKSPPPESKCSHQVIWSEQTSQKSRASAQQHQSWKSPWTQWPQEGCQRRGCNFHLLQLSPKIHQERLESIPKVFYKCFPSSGTTPQAAEIQAGRQITEHCSLTVTQLSVSKTPMKAAVF